MADESLGHIDIRFPTAGGGGGGTGGGGGGTAAAGNAFGTALTNILKNAGSFKNVISTGVGGGSVGDIVGGAAGAARSAGGGVGAMSLGVAVGGIAIIASVMVGVKMAVGSILSRVSELARVNPAMAMQAALASIADMKRDMQEARVLGPLYKNVMEIVTIIKDLLAPVFLIIKAIFTGTMLIILNVIKDAITAMLPTLALIANAVGAILLKLFENKDSAATLFKDLSNWSKNSPSIVSGFTGIIGGIGQYIFGSGAIMDGIKMLGTTLIQISGQISAATNTQTGSNAYFTDMLKALSAPSATGIPAAIPRPRFTSP